MDATATLSTSGPTPGSTAWAFSRSVGMRLADLDIDDLTAGDLVLLCSTHHHLIRERRAHEDELPPSRAP
jgi:hypothetical protein